MKTIKRESRGKDVDLLQTILEIPHNPSQEFNITTHNAVIEFQKCHGLVVDGIVGYKTWEKLFFRSDTPKFGITEKEFERAALLLDCEATALKSVQKVETGGKGGFLPSGRPRILFEGHIFWQQLKAHGVDPVIHQRGNEDILYPRWTKEFYRGGEAEYERLLRARQIQEDAANCSASWGMFQIMGMNYRLCGEPSVAHFAKAMYASECMQLLLSCRFIHNNASMLSALQKRDWAAFARLYNGPSYSKNAYDRKLQAAYHQYSPTKEAKNNFDLIDFL